MSNTEPLGVAFVEIEPVAAGFRTKTEAQLRTQLAGVSAGIPPSPQTAASTRQLQSFSAAAGEAAAAETTLSAATERAAASNLTSLSSQQAVVDATTRLTAVKAAAAAAGEKLVEGTVHEAAAVQSLALATESSTQAAAADLSVKEALVGVTHQAAAAASTELAAIEAVTAATAGEAAAVGTDAAAINALTTAETEGTGAATRKAAAETEAAAATRLHGIAARHAAKDIATEAGSMAGLGGAAGALSLPLIGAAAASVALFKSLEEADQFNETMHRIEASTHATRDELEQVRGTAIGLGRDLELPLTTANDAVQAINLLTRAGFNLQDSLTAARGALLLTAASGEDLRTSVTEIDRILDAFNLSAEHSEEVANAISVGMRFTADSASEFASALATIAPAADLMGLSLADTTTLVLQLAESGLSANQSAGSLRQAFLRLATATGPQGKQIREALSRIDLTVRDLITSTGDLRPDAFVRLANALGNVSEEQRKAILIQIFTRRAALGVLRIIDQQEEGYRRMSETARDSTAAQEEAEARARSFGGQLSELGSDVSDVGLKLGRVAQGPATLFVKAIRDVARQADNALTAIDLLGGGVINLGRDFVNAIPHARDFLAVLQDIAGAQRDPVGFLGGFIKDIPGQFKDAAAGLQQAINLNVGGIADIPGIRDLADNLNKLSGSFDTTRGKVKRAMDGMNEDVGIGVTELAGTIRAGVPQVASAGSQLSLAIAQAQASGDQGAELAALRQREAGQVAFIERQSKLPQTKARVATETRANQQLAQTRASIKAILDERIATAKGEAADAQKAADDIVKAADERDRAFIQTIENQRGNREAAVGIAATTDDTLRDDIRANVKLRNFLANAIEETRKRIREVRAAGRSAADLVVALGNLRRSRNEVRRELERLNQESQERVRQTRVESAQLDLQILEARVGDDPTARQTTALVNAHLRVIAALRKAQGLTKKRSIEWKRLQLDIENELSAIRDLKKAQRDAAGETKDFSQQAFAFLQELHGFSSNLASNILPTGSTIGGGGGDFFGGGGGATFSGSFSPSTVGGGSTSTTTPPFTRPPVSPNPNVLSPFEHGRGRGDTTGAAALREQRGGPATFGQMEKLLHVTQNTNAILRDLRRGVGHPEAHHTRRQGRHPVETGVD